MIKKYSKFFSYLGLVLFFSLKISSDNFFYNTYNNHGVLGLINMPSARFYDEGAVGITVYDGNPDQKITMTSSPYNWLEASFFYTNIQGKPYPGYEYQDYKDKGFNFKLKLKNEGVLPAIAIGINDIAGTGYFSSEYIVGTYGVNNFDFHLGLGWGTLNGSNKTIKNPLSFIHDSFSNRPTETEGLGGQFQPSRYFSGKEASPFFGMTYAYNDKLTIKIERDTTLAPGKLNYNQPEYDYSYGIEYQFNKNFSVGFFNERGNNTTFKFIYKKDASASDYSSEYKKTEKRINSSSVDYFVQSLESNGIGVNKVIQGAKGLGIEITQFTHPNLNVIEEIIYVAKKDANINQDIKYEYRVADLKAYSEFNDDFIKDSKILYQRKNQEILILIMSSA